MGFITIKPPFGRIFVGTCSIRIRFFGAFVAKKSQGYDVVIDGHHRLELFKSAGLTIVPAVSVNYEHPDILVNPPGLRPDVCKEMVISTAVKGKTLEPKTTQHLVRSRGGALLPIIVLAPQIAEVVK